MAAGILHVRQELTYQTSEEVMDAEAARYGFEIHNEGPGSIRIGLEGQTPTLLLGIKVRAGKSYRVNGTQGVDHATGDWPNTGAIECISLGDFGNEGGTPFQADTIINTVEFVHA